MVSNFEAVLVKFDESYPSKSDLDKQFQQLASELRFTNNFLVAEVKVPYRSDSGKDTDLSAERRLAEKLSAAKTDDLPVVYLFKRGQFDSPILFKRKEDDSNFNAKSLRDFVRASMPRLRLLLEGTIESLEELAFKFSCSKATVEQRKAILKEVESAVETLPVELKTNGKVYSKVMERIIERGEIFQTIERQRITNLLAGQMSEPKKKQLLARLNILESFHPSKPIKGKDEL